jgi:hypothetical protein
LGEGVGEGIAVNAQRHRAPQIQVIQRRLVPVDERVAIYCARRNLAVASGIGSPPGSTTALSD